MLTLSHMEKSSYYAFILFALSFCALALGKVSANGLVFADATTTTVTGSDFVVKLLLLLGLLCFLAGGYLVVSGLIKKKN